MMKKGIVFGILLLFSISCQAGMTICNRFSCQDANSYDSKEVLDALSLMFIGGRKELLFCSADKQTKTCYEKPITFMGRTNLMSVEFQIPFARIYQAQQGKDGTQIVLDYQVQTNRYYPMCSPSNTTLSLSVSNQGDFLLDSADFNCRITELGKTSISIRFLLDYLDLEKGYLGGAYQISVQGDVLGGGTGYALLQFSEKRAIELPRPIPPSYLAGYESYSNEEKWSRQNSVEKAKTHVNTEAKESLAAQEKVIEEDLEEIDSAMDTIKKKWDDFKTTLLNILYLESSDD